LLSSAQDIDMTWRSDTARARPMGWWRCLTCGRAFADPQADSMLAGSAVANDAMYRRQAWCPTLRYTRPITSLLSPLYSWASTQPCLSSSRLIPYATAYATLFGQHISKDTRNDSGHRPLSFADLVTPPSCGGYHAAHGRSVPCCRSCIELTPHAIIFVRSHGRGRIQTPTVFCA